MQTAVHFGPLALRDSGTIEKVDWIDKRFQEFSREVEEYFERFLGERGELQRAFSDTDGPIRLLRDPQNESSPIYELRRGLEEDIQRLHNQVVGEAAREEGAKAVTKKGFKFEDALYELLEPICSKTRDRVKKIGTTTTAGRQVGDLLIEVYEKHLSDPLRIIIEAKSGSLSVHGDDGLLKELDQAIELRKAQSAIGIVKESRNLLGFEGPLGYFIPEEVLCAFDPDETPLELAYKFARTEALLKALGQPVLDQATCVGVLSKMVEIKKKIDTLSNAKRHLTNIEKSSGKIRKIIRALQSDISGTLADVEGIIRASAAAETKKTKKTGK